MSLKYTWPFESLCKSLFRGEDTLTDFGKNALQIFMLAFFAFFILNIFLQMHFW